MELKQQNWIFIIWVYDVDLMFKAFISNLRKDVKDKKDS